MCVEISHKAEQYAGYNRFNRKAAQELKSLLNNSGIIGEQLRDYITVEECEERYNKAY